MTKSTDQKSKSDMEYNHQEENLNSANQTKSHYVPDDIESNTKKRGSSVDFSYQMDNKLKIAPKVMSSCTFIWII